MTLIIVAAVLLIIVLIVATMYNKLVRLRNSAKSSWSDIDVQLKKRYNLIPNLVETVKGYASHESGVFQKVTEARSRAMQVTTPAEMAKAENVFKDTLKSLFSITEAYPDLKANKNFQELQAQLEVLENGIEQSRRYYNAIVRDYNTLTETFPSVIIANMFGFKQFEFFQLDSTDERKAPKVDFS